MRRIWWRIVPLLTLVMFFSALDRVNLAFAAVTMNQALNFSNTVLGNGAGMFAIGYTALAIPSTLLLYRFGARRWIALIAVAWSLCSAATAFVTTPMDLMIVRFLLGATEAGFTPGAALYFSTWFPNAYRGRVFACFFFVTPLTLVIGGPLSSVLLSLDGRLGLDGWQWLFLIEALPGLVLAAIVYLTLADTPAEARWLTSEERAWLEDRLANERATASTTTDRHTLRDALGDRRVWGLAAIYLALGTSGIGAVIFLPLMIQSMGFSVWATGFVTGALGVTAAVMLPLWGIWADRAARREGVVAAAAAALAVGLVGAAALLPSPWALATIGLALIGFHGFVAPFWTLPAKFLTGAGAAAGIAFINTAGNLGLFTGPAIVGRTVDATASYSVAMTVLGVLAAIVSAALTARLLKQSAS